MGSEPPKDILMPLKKPVGLTSKISGQSYQGDFTQIFLSKNLNDSSSTVGQEVESVALMDTASVNEGNISNIAIQNVVRFNFKL